jgi:GntR family transcriptional regulator/MocR family aminotransferase
VDFHVTLSGRGDLGGQIYRQLRAAVLDGRLRPGEALPPSRELAGRLEVSRNTVTGAYDRLVAEGFADSRIGAGTFARLGDPGRVGERGAPVGGPVRPRALWAGTTVPTARFLDDAPEFDLRAGLPDVRLFPYEAWRRLTVRELRAAAMGTGMHGDPAGHAGLRAAIARHIGLSRAVRTSAADVFVSQGVQQALDIIGRVLVEPGDRVAVEDPGYPPARELFRSMGAEVVGVPVDRDGLRVDALPHDAKVVYVTPSHQFPLGMPMALGRRLALLDWVRRRDAVIIEDDYDTEFRYGGRPIEPLQSLDDTGRVLYVGTFSKVMFPALRLGFVVAPASLHEALRAAKYVTDWHSATPTQAALAAFIDEGLLARHVRRMRREYQARHGRIAELLIRDFAGVFTSVPAEAGLHLSAWAAAGVDVRETVRRARAAGVGLYPLSQFRMADGPDGLIFGYGAIPQQRIDEALRRLRAAVVFA